MVVCLLRDVLPTRESLTMLVLCLGDARQAGDLIKVGQIQGMVTNVGVLETTVMAFDGIKVTYANGQIKGQRLAPSLSGPGDRPEAARDGCSPLCRDGRREQKGWRPEDSRALSRCRTMVSGAAQGDG